MKMHKKLLNLAHLQPISVFLDCGVTYPGDGVVKQGAASLLSKFCRRKTVFSFVLFFFSFGDFSGVE